MQEGVRKKSRGLKASVRCALDPFPALRYIGAMTRDAQKSKGGKDAAREDRLKAALKANLARRKAQARARTDKASDAGDAEDNNKN